jgi:dTDP-glucose 4,6-dehydratase
MKTIFITGGAGFIGSNFVKYWYKNHPEYKIIVIDNLGYAGNTENIPLFIREDTKRFEFWFGNVCNGELINSLVARSNIVVHFAAESHVARSIYDNHIFYVTDVLGTQTVSTAVVKNKKTIEKFVHISTSEVYGSADYEPMDEEHPLNPKSPYASAKCGADRLVYSFIQTYDIPATIIRPFNQYGPYQHLEKVIPRFITAALKNETLTVHGTGEARRDWLYVEDTCERLEKVILADIDKIKGEVFNLGSGEVFSVLDIAEMVTDILNKPKNLINKIGDRLGQVQHHVSSTNKAAEVLGVTPGRSFKEGLEQTIKWYAENESWWKKIEWMSHVPIMTADGKVEMH